MCKISIIIPAYNAEISIEKALDSALNQDLKDIEVICIDDGSIDKTAQKVKTRALSDDRVKYLFQENHGAGSARNLGISQARGEYIAFLDADDYYPSNEALKKLYLAAIANEADVCGGSAIFSNGEQPEKYKFDSNKLISFEDYQFDFLFWRFIYNRQFLLQNEIRFPELRVYEDPLFLARALHAAGSFYSIHDNVYVYTGTHNSVNVNLQKTKDFLKGIAKELELSSEWKYKRLHTMIFQRLDTQASYYAEKNIDSGDIELLRLLLKADSAIDRHLIPDICDDEYIIPAIKTAYSAGAKYIRLQNSKFGKLIRKVKK